MKYIDAEQLKTKVKELNLATKTYEEQVAFNNALAMVVEIIDSLQQEQQDVNIREEIKKLEFMGSNDARDIQHVAEHFYELGLMNHDN